MKRAIMPIFLILLAACDSPQKSNGFAKAMMDLGKLVRRMELTW